MYIELGMSRLKTPLKKMRGRSRDRHQVVILTRWVRNEITFTSDVNVNVLQRSCCARPKPVCLPRSKQIVRTHWAIFRSLRTKTYFAFDPCIRVVFGGDFVKRYTWSTHKTNCISPRCSTSSVCVKLLRFAAVKIRSYRSNFRGLSSILFDPNIMHYISKTNPDTECLTEEHTFHLYYISIQIFHTIHDLYWLWGRRKVVLP